MTEETTSSQKKGIPHSINPWLLYWSTPSNQWWVHNSNPRRDYPVVTIHILSWSRIFRDKKSSTWRSFSLVFHHFLFLFVIFWWSLSYIAIPCFISKVLDVSSLFRRLSHQDNHLISYLIHVISIGNPFQENWWDRDLGHVENICFFHVHILIDMTSSILAATSFS